MRPKATYLKKLLGLIDSQIPEAEVEFKECDPPRFILKVGFLEWVIYSIDPGGENNLGEKRSPVLHVCKFKDGSRSIIELGNFTEKMFFNWLFYQIACQHIEPDVDVFEDPDEDREYFSDCHGAELLEGERKYVCKKCEEECEAVKFPFDPTP